MRRYRLRSVAVHRRVVGALALALVAAACSSSKSEGTVTTTAAPATTAAAATSTAPPETSSGSTAAPTTAKPSGPVKIVVGVDGDPPTLDPAGNANGFTTFSVLLAIDDLLMGTTEVQGEPKPLLLESLTEAPDRMSWTAKLRPNLTFHDGTPIDSAAVKFNLDRYKASLYTAPELEPVTSVDIVDPLTVSIKLKQPWTALPSELDAIPGIMVSPKSVQDQGDAFGRNPTGGSGPFIFKEWIPNDHITVVKNPNYWGEPAKVDEIEFRFITEETARISAMKAGDIDAMTGILEENITKLSADPDVVLADPGTQGYGVSLINNTKPGLDDARVRRALDMAIDRDAIEKTFGGDTYAETGSGPFPKDNKWWLAPDQEPKFDPEGAKALLAEYGKPVSFTYSVIGTPQSVVDQLKATVQMWQDVGIDAKLQVVPDVVQLVTNVVLGNYDMASWAGAVTFDPDPMTYNFFHTGASRNYQKSSDPEMDAALDQGRTSNDPAVRKQAYDTFQKRFRETMPILISSFGRIYIAGNKNLTGLDPIAFFPSRTVAVAN
jgi:peptide/nickel transport system substrate-binding protein